MKLRLGFVANSSSSSFSIPLAKISGSQLEQICNHAELAEQWGLECADQPWDIEVTESEVQGFVWMDNFSMSDFLEKIGIPGEVVTFGDY